MPNKKGQLDGKVCTKCKEWKEFSEYHTLKRKDGSRSPVARCKACANAINRKYAQENSAAAVDRTRRWRELPGNTDRKNALERQRRKDEDVKKKNAEYNTWWRKQPENQAALAKRRRDRRKKDPEFRAALLVKQREYYSRPDVIERDREKRKHTQYTKELKDKFNARRRERYVTDPLFLCSMKCRAMIYRVVKKASITKEDKTIELLGYSPDQLRQRLECQFKRGMSWGNYGEWNIDHKKPISAFLAQGITKQNIINALCNLQPMWREENQKKSAKWPLPANENTTRRHDEPA